MPYSKLCNELEFDENQWVVSLINTQTGIKGIIGGHAKIVVEGLKVNQGNPGFFSPELFVGEYHIMEAERVPEENWIPQVFRNTRCKYLVLCKDDCVGYSKRQEEQYKAVRSRSVGGVLPSEALRMIKAIKEEKESIDGGTRVGNFQYLGRWCAYGIDNADNCLTWAERQLDIIGLGKHLITDSSKASPFLHVNSSRWLSCVLM